MPTEQEIEGWKDEIHTRYLNYLTTSFYFKDADLRESFKRALDDCELMKGPFPESAHDFEKGINARELAKKCFDAPDDMLPALRDDPLYVHQEQAIRKVHKAQQNVVVATGTASGKTESFLYPILFDLYQQHLDGKLSEPGVRALILYPMNALANDQRRRLGEICQALEDANSDFKPTFGQYIGATPEDERDRRRNATTHEKNRLAGELVFRKEMRNTPPHILLTNYSMLEYLLIRPDDSELFDDDRGQHWQFIVLDEAHQYRGAKGMEMGMLVRRLKQRLQAGGREHPFRCIATSATLSSGEGLEDRESVARFSSTLFGEVFDNHSVIFGQKEKSNDTEPQRFHLFMSALEGAFLSYQNSEDIIILNRETETDDNEKVAALEIALCRECGQHYYVGRENDGCLVEAIRDPSHHDFGVDFYLPLDDETEEKLTHCLCRRCGKLSKGTHDLACECDATIPVRKCDNRQDHPDQLKTCETCGYSRGSIGDPVQEIVHGSDGPNSVIATALHGLLPKGDRRKILCFADSRQEAAFFAWYAQDSYEKVRDRNFILRALQQNIIDEGGLSIEGLRSRLQKICDDNDIFPESDETGDMKRKALGMIFRELLTEKKRLSLEGVGLAKWSVKIRDRLQLPDSMFKPPWNFTQDEGRDLVRFLLDSRFRQKRAVKLPEGAPPWGEVSPRPQQAVRFGSGGKNIESWGSAKTGVVKHFLRRLHSDTDSGLTDKEKYNNGETLMNSLWDAIQDYSRHISGDNKLLVEASTNGTFYLNPAWLRIELPSPQEYFECDTCAKLSFYNIRDVCPRNGCPGKLVNADQERVEQNHYRTLYKDDKMPARLRAEEHSAQLSNEEAQKRQDEFIAGELDLLSSSTTFEVGVDLGDLEAVFLRNVPPEPFNYTQRVGRAGRRSDMPGLALTYCRRNPHDLYHYADPKKHILQGKVYPPQLRLKNEKIILRHITAVALSAFFRVPVNCERFENVKQLIGGDWEKPRAVADFRDFCRNNQHLIVSLRAVVPKEMHKKTGLNDGSWADNIASGNSRFADAEQEVCNDYRQMRENREEYRRQDKDYKAGHIGKRMETIADEKSLNFLSRKAIIPKYGFPVDVVELDTRPRTRGDARKVSLQRDLSQAIAEYAPASKVVANKQEWESCGVKIIHGKALAVKRYHYDQARDFKQWGEHAQSPDGIPKKGGYLSPQFGFVTELNKKPKEPQGRARRLYTTRPFFEGFVGKQQPSKKLLGAKITPAPGRMVVLCEGKNGAGFYICRGCGAGFAERKYPHKTPENNQCSGTLEQLALGHEFVTDVIRLQFPELRDQWQAYSLAYAVLLGAAQRLDVPATDLNATITAGETADETAIVLYDNVPGGAGLVASLEKGDVFSDVLGEAKNRVSGQCGCTESCYGCIRSYRNQFAHPHLQRADALDYLESALAERSH